MPGNRDEFPFSQAEWSLPSYFPPFVRSRESSVKSERKLIVTPQGLSGVDRSGSLGLWIFRSVVPKALRFLGLWVLKSLGT